LAFTHEITVRFHEVDRAGIAFYGRVFQYVHVAFEELLLAMGPGWTSVFDGDGWGMPLVHAEADFKRPMALHDRLVITAEVTAMSKRSLTFEFRVVGAEDGVLRATARQVHAFVDLAAFEPISMPDELRAGLDRMGLLDHLEDPPA
jgi:YbgC/YbaW family acyl-CoA thioester hydrolase